jgi:hypothetical protein
MVLPSTGGRSRHPNKEVEEAVAEAEDKEWVFRPMGHWGRIFVRIRFAGKDVR